LTLACDTEGKPPTLDLETLGELDRCLDEIEAHAGDLRVVLLRSASQKYFVTGANIAALGTLSSATMGEWGEAGHVVLARLEALRVPTVACVEGYALGGGLELALACDLIIAGEGAQVGLPEAKLGLVPGWGGTLRLTRRVGAARAKLLMFTGRMLTAGEAKAWGLVDVVATGGTLETVVGQLAGELESTSGFAVREIKALVQAGDGGWERARDLEAAASRRCFDQGDARERIAAFLSRRRSSSG
jgi:enoyl-CoA hydratase